MNSITQFLVPLGTPVFLAFVLSTAGQALDDPLPNLRTWKDRSGAHQLKAEFAGCEKNGVRLKKTDGSIVWVPLKNLSTADKWFVRKQRQQNGSRNLTGTKTGELPVPPGKAPSGILEADPAPGNGDAGKAAPPRRNTQRLFGVDWHRTPESLVAAASSGKQKPILWFRVLGDLEGFM
ncbi:MAG: SHD1 domain-containing protein [Planctomycetota bacterium]|nr:SHD1 domain-containing protein [Planctomycetota bacterium]